ncbi:hypothetical protein [Streptantibioticus ferralitis]|uniref:Uncharacterized protein n=1 Tax=Streptantibioticus ferralitis TaxID=236510 RepID=A0ABT5ZAD8_9ACTN|nr:hypothetical protein [Streptantibioticus ferralitis]MDF2260800.1 hypothetical protein [Streptantibioticus ferralitis]
MTDPRPRNGRAPRLRSPRNAAATDADADAATAAALDPAAGGHVLLPAEAAVAPLRQVGRRLAIAAAVLVATAFIVHADREGYHDNAGGGVGVRSASPSRGPGRRPRFRPMPHHRA